MSLILLLISVWIPDIMPVIDILLPALLFAWSAVANYFARRWWKQSITRHDATITRALDELVVGISTSMKPLDHMFSSHYCCFGLVHVKVRTMFRSDSQEALGFQSAATCLTAFVAVGWFVYSFAMTFTQGYTEGIASIVSLHVFYLEYCYKRRSWTHLPSTLYNVSLGKVSSG